MAGPHHGTHEGRGNDARRLLDERLRREDRQKNPWSPQPPFTTTIIVFMLVVGAMFAVAWLGF